MDLRSCGYGCLATLLLALPNPHSLTRECCGIWQHPWIAVFLPSWNHRKVKYVSHSFLSVFLTCARCCSLACQDVQYSHKRPVKSNGFYLEFTVVNQTFTNHPISPSFYLSQASLTRAVLHILVNSYLEIEITIPKDPLIIDTTAIQNGNYSATKAQTIENWQLDEMRW